jgi:hypothetical protein
MFSYEGRVTNQQRKLLTKTPGGGCQTFCVALIQLSNNRWIIIRVPGISLPGKQRLRRIRCAGAPVGAYPLPG